MATTSGKYAQALFGSCNFLEFESWDLEYGANIPTYNARSGGGATQTVEGVFDGGGTISGFLDPDDPLTSQVTSGALITLSLHITSTGPVQATGQARLGKFNMSANRSGEPVPVSIPFVTHGTWTLP